MAEILSMKNITKVYPNGFVANKDINLYLRKGEIHALLGENGAGKTTLMKILFGLEKPEEGTIILRGQEVHIDGPLDAIAKGIGMVHQHFMLLPSLTVAENIVLGLEPKKNGMFDLKKAIQITRELSEKYELHVDPEAIVGDLSVGVKQKIEILKALLRGSEVLVLDEPTAVLTPQETKELFVELRRLREQGHTIIFISHKLDEVKELCDRYTVLRRGQTVGTGEVFNTTPQEMSKQMVGRDVVLKIKKDKASPKETVLAVEGLNYVDWNGKKVLQDVSFTMQKAKILGIAGIEGNGQTELSEILTGLRTFSNGDVMINGKSIKGKTIREIREFGVANISEDRMTLGCAAKSSVKDNIIVDRYYKNQFAKGIVQKKKQIEKFINDQIRDFSIKCKDGDESVEMLSGGNIQKVIVAREFSSDSMVIIANQPTRGIDVGSTEFIRNNLIKLSRKNNVSVLLISADLNEVLEVSDSLMVMKDGRITAYFEDTSSISEFEVGEYMLGLRKMDENEMRSELFHVEKNN